jgi:hypothetical protein
MKVKAGKLTGYRLDWAVAKCEGKNGALHDDGITRCIVIVAASGLYNGIWKPTVNWTQGGPIIEREEICISICTWNNPWFGKWNATSNKDGSVDEYGNTPLIAAMRCYVASKLGEVIEVPDELNKG